MFNGKVLIQFYLNLENFEVMDTVAFIRGMTFYIPFSYNFANSPRLWYIVTYLFKSEWELSFLFLRFYSNSCASGKWGPIDQ